MIVPDQFRTQEMCEKAVEEWFYVIKYVPNWSVTPKILEYLGNSKCSNKKVLDAPDDWRKGYKQCKAQKAQLKEELLPIARHPFRWLDWCIPENEKTETEKLFKDKGGERTHGVCAAWQVSDSCFGYLICPLKKSYDRFKMYNKRCLVLNLVK